MSAILYQFPHYSRAFEHCNLWRIRLMSPAAFVLFIPFNIVVTPLQLMCSEKSSFPQAPPFFLLSWTDPIVPKLNYSIKERGAWTQRDYMGVWGVLIALCLI